MNGRYMLNADHSVIEVDDLMTWARWLEMADRNVAKTDVGDIRVSTVFLGLDHSFDDAAAPILFETMVFGGQFDQECERYSTWGEAVAGHHRMVGRLQGFYEGANT